MKTYILLFTSLFLITACQEPRESQTEENSPAEIKPPSSPTYSLSIPKGYSLLAETWGDLNKDGVEEWIRIYNTDREGDFGVERELYIYEKKLCKRVL